MYWHWSERLAEQLISLNKDKIIITAGVTPSGPVHLGTVCEFLFPEAIYRMIKIKNPNLKVEMYFIADVLDALDSITADLIDYKDILEKEMGKPLEIAIDPKYEYNNYAERYINELKLIMQAFNTNLKLIKVSELYRQGKFDEYAIKYIKQLDKVKKIIERTSGRKLSEDWSPIMVICDRCNRIDSTKILNFNLETFNYNYLCKACGYEGENNLLNHRYKLQWRLHWPSWQAILETDIEGGGVDHFTRGGSRDTAEAIHKEILEREPPIGYKYGFILLGGKKYSKSKGTGMYVRDMLKFIPPEIIAYHLLKYDLEENIDFDPTKDKIINMIDDYETASQLNAQAELNRADRKRYVAFKLYGKETRASFKEMLLYYSIYRDWSIIKSYIEVDENYIKYIENWFKENFVPDEYNFNYSPSKLQIYRDLVESWDESMSALDIHNKVYEYAKAKNIESKDVFKELYKAIIGKEKGPRLGKLVYAIGVNKIKKDLL